MAGPSLRGADSVLFDLDGVIVDSRVPFVRCVNAALAAHDLAPRPDGELHEYLGPPLHGTFVRLGATGVLAQSCVDVYRRRYTAMAAAETTVFPGIEAVIAELAASRPLVVATSKARALAEPLLADLGLRPFFRAVVGPDLDARDERKAVTVGRALQELPAGSSPVMVGDRKFDVIAGREHGIPTIGVLWGIGSAEELRASGADALAREPADLIPLITTRRRVLLTGMSGTGKSTLVAELRRRGFAAYDADDDGFSEPRGDGRWGWRRAQVAELLDGADGLLFFAGCSEEQAELPFDFRVLLRAPEDVLVERLRTRTTNAYARDGDELAQVLADRAEVEPLLERSADLVLTSTAPAAELADAVLAAVLDS